MFYSVRNISITIYQFELSYRRDRETLYAPHCVVTTEACGVRRPARCARTREAARNSFANSGGRSGNDRRVPAQIEITRATFFQIHRRPFISKAQSATLRPRNGAIPGRPALRCQQ